MSWSDASLSSLGSAIESFEAASLTAPLKFPSSSLADIRAAKRSIGGRGRLENTLPQAGLRSDLLALGVDTG